MAKGCAVITIECALGVRKLELHRPITFHNVVEQVSVMYGQNDFTVHFRNSNILLPVLNDTDLEYALHIYDLGGSDETTPLIFVVSFDSTNDPEKVIDAADFNLGYKTDPIVSNNTGDGRRGITRARSFPRSGMTHVHNARRSVVNRVSSRNESSCENELNSEARFIPEDNFDGQSGGYTASVSGESRNSLHSTSSSSQNLSQFIDSPPEPSMTASPRMVGVPLDSNRSYRLSNSCSGSFKLGNHEGMFLPDHGVDSGIGHGPAFFDRNLGGNHTSEDDEILAEEVLDGIETTSVDFNRVADSVGLCIDTTLCESGTPSNRRQSSCLSYSRASKNSGNASQHSNSDTTAANQSANIRSINNQSHPPRQKTAENCTSFTVDFMQESFGNDEAYSLEHWVPGKRLGHGGFGEVSVYYNKHTGVESAVKQIKLTEANSRKVLRTAEQEIRVLSRYSHERIVKFYGSKIDSEKQCIYIFMEYIPGNSVKSQIDQYGCVSESVCSKYLAQILEGLVYLHSENIVHRDLKCDNILRDSLGNTKLADFGCARLRTDYLKHSGVNSLMLGTPYWMSPEVIISQPYDGRADIWSLGCSIVEMMTGEPPNHELESMPAIYRVATNKKCQARLPINSSAPLVDIVHKCLTYDQNQRPTAEDLMSHEFVVSSQW